MMRTLFSFLLVFHGLIHVIGFVKEFGYGFASQLNSKRLLTLSPDVWKIVGVFWVITGVLFIFTMLVFALHKNWWWMIGLVAIVLSQLLIVLYWSDAKFGTISNVIILVAIIFGIASANFNRQFDSSVRSLKSDSRSEVLLVSEQSIAHLPSNVQRWLRQSNCVGRTHDNVIHVFQKGTLRLKPDANWMPFQSEEYFTIDPPSFIWRAEIKPSVWMTIGGLDRYTNGSGQMLIKPYYLFTAADAIGDEIDQGTLLRFLGEMSWFPQAAITPYLKWEEIDLNHARVTMNYRGVEASGVFTFDEKGLISGFEAQRYGDFGGEYRLETWSVRVTGFKTFDDKVIGNRNEVAWKLKGGDFVWMKMEVLEIVKSDTLD